MFKTLIKCTVLSLLLVIPAQATIYLQLDTIEYESIDLENTPIAEVYYASMDIFVGDDPTWGGLSLYSGEGGTGTEMFLIGFDSTGEFGVKNKANGDPWTDVLDFEAGATYHIILEVNQSLETIKLWVTNRYYETPDYSGEPEDGVSSTGSEFQNPLSIICFVGQWGSSAEYYNILISDDITDHFIVAPPELASNPSPANEANDVATDVVLNWTPGIYAGTHQLYLGTSFEDVNDATTPLAELDVNNFTPDSPLELGQTYYWRIDEVNATSDHTTFTSNIWSFSVEPIAFTIGSITAEASSYNGTSPATNLINGSGLNEEDQHSTSVDDMWVSGFDTGEPQSIVFSFEQAFMLHELLVWNANQTVEKFMGRGVKEAMIEISNDGINWTTLYDSIEFARASFSADYEANTVVDLQGTIAQYVRLTCKSNWLNIVDAYCLSEVRFTYIPTQARRPNPEDGAQTKRLDVPLQWRSGRDASEHEIFFGTDANLVQAGDASVWLATSNDPQVEISDLVNYQQTYHWKVNELYTDPNYPMCEGEAWSFSTPDSLVIDNMEGYDDDNTRIFDIWADGYNDKSNGSQVGYTSSPFVEVDLVHRGKKAMPFAYSDTKGATESYTTRSFSPAQDWTAGGLQSMVLYFLGDPDNDEGQLYVTINQTRIDYPEASHLTRRAWTAWLIDLSDIDVSAVSSMTIGVDNYGSGEGLLIIDDMELYRIAPEETDPAVAVDPGTDNLIGLYHLNGNLQDDSGNSYHGTDVNSVDYSTGIEDQALELSGRDCVDLGNLEAWNPTGSFSISLWANANNWNEEWGGVMISNRGESSVGWQIRRYSSTDNLCFTTRGNGSEDTSSRLPILTDEWIHITCVFDIDTNKKYIYLNGSLDVSVSTTGESITASDHNAFIGARTVDDNSYQEGFFDGMIDEVRIYDDALTADEVVFLAGQ